MSEKTIKIAVCKWSDRLTASYFPVNQLYAYTDPVTGLTAHTRFDAYGRQIGDPNFGMRRLFVKEEKNDDGYTYTTFQSDETSNILVYKSVGSLEQAASESGGGSISTSTFVETSSALPNPVEGNVGKTYQFIGTTTSSFTKNHFYTCEFVGGAYVWSDTTPSSGSSNSVLFVSSLPAVSDAEVDRPYLLTVSDSDGHTAGKIYIVRTGSSSWEIVNKGYPVGDCSNIRCFKMSDSTTVRLKWKDPTNPSSEGVELSKWKQTTVVRKTGGYPTGVSDGTVVVVSTVRDQYDSANLLDTVPDASQTYYYGFFPETDEGVITLSDGTSNRAVTGTVTFATLRDLTRTGEISSIIEVGTSFEVSHSVYGSLEVQIVGYNAVLPSAVRYVATDGTTIYVKASDGVGEGRTVYSDEACTVALSDTISDKSGTFIIGNSENGRDVEPNQITVGGKIYYCRAYSTVLYSRFLVPTTDGATANLGCQFDAPELEYGESEDTTYQASKTYYSYDGVSTYTQLVAGTDYQVGDAITSVVYEKNLNDRKNYGYGRWSQSGIRQFLNADTVSNWWVKKNIFDKPFNLSSSQGFLYGLDSDFKSCLGKVYSMTAVNTVDGGGGVEYTDDYIFLPSNAQIFGSANNSYYEGSQFTLCQTWTDATRKKCTKAMSQTSSPSYSYYWLRSSIAWSVYNAYYVSTSGGLSYHIANYSLGVAFACALI